MTVYVVQEPVYRDHGTGLMVPRFDLTPAAVYGDIEYLTAYGTVSLTPMPVIRALRHKLRKFSDDDYILPAGDPVLIGMAVMIAADSNMGRVKVLKWDKPLNGYIVIQIDKGA